MFALVESGSITKMLNGRRGITIGDIQHPQQIFTLWTEAERNAIGVYTIEIDNTNKKVYLIWILSVITFFFSAVLDNLTTAIVMAALLPKLIKDKETLWLFAGVLIIAANAGGAWSPIGDVTTIMLWIGGQVSATNIITSIIVPSMVCAIVPLIYLSFKKIPKYKFLYKFFKLPVIFTFFKFVYEVIAFFLYLKNKKQLKN